MSKKVFIEKIGCTRRGLDGTRLTDYFRLNGYQIVDYPRSADLIILLTCGYKQSVEDSSLRSIDRLKRYKGELIVMGCIPDTSPTAFAKKFNGRYLTPKDIDKVDEFFPDFKVKFNSLPDGNTTIPIKRPRFIGILLEKIKFFRPLYARLAPDERMYFFSKNKSAVLRICHGCLGSCSYCAIRFAIGKLRSKPLEVCLDEYSKLVASGQRKFILNGEDAGAYGIDMGISFPELLSKLLRHNDKTEFSIETLNPRWAIKYKDKLTEAVRTKRILRIKCDIQSGSERILKLMNRYSNIEDIKKTLLDFRAANPKINLASQFIIGFPSETESEFQDTLHIVKQLKLNLAQIFLYSDRERSPSSTMPGKIPGKILKKRSQAMEKCLRSLGYKKIKTEHSTLFHNPHISSK